MVFRASGAEAADPPRRSEFTAARAKVVLGDGAKWIWNIASELFPGAVEIGDLWHARQHVWAVGREVYGPTQRCATPGRRRPARRCRRAASTTCWWRFGSTTAATRRGVAPGTSRPTVTGCAIRHSVPPSCRRVRARREPRPDAALLVAGRPIRRVLPRRA